MRRHPFNQAVRSRRRSIVARGGGEKMLILFDVVPAMVAHQQKFSAACWHVGDVAYALVATADFGELDRAATRLDRSLY